MVFLGIHGEFPSFPRLSPVAHATATSGHAAGGRGGGRRCTAAGGLGGSQEVEGGLQVIHQWLLVGDLEHYFYIL